MLHSMSSCSQRCYDSSTSPMRNATDRPTLYPHLQHGPAPPPAGAAQWPALPPALPAAQELGPASRASVFGKKGNLISKFKIAIITSNGAGSQHNSRWALCTHACCVVAWWLAKCKSPTACKYFANLLGITRKSWLALYRAEQKG